MAKVICLVGLPGSGKSTLLIKIMMEHPGLAAYDNIIKGHVEGIRANLDSGKDCIVTDPFFTLPSVRGQVERMLQGHQIEWIFFENAPHKCRANVKRRMDAGDTREVEGSIRRFTEEYVIPDGVIPLEVFGGRTDGTKKDS